MCGLIGGSGLIEARYLVALGCLAEDRGSDSAGVAWQAGGNLRVAKVAKNPLVAYPVDLAPAIRHAAKYKSPLIGHTRQATQGAITQRNAHPFLDETGKIAWAHNGIILNDEKFGTFEVDSECLIGGIRNRNFSPYQGPIALLWIENGKLHAFRKSNPLHRGVKRGAVYLASEAAMLESIGCHRIKPLSEGFVYVWEGDRLSGTSKVPVHEFTRQGEAWRGDDFYEEGYHGGGRGYTPGFRNGHNYFRDGNWHTHIQTIAWSNECAACNPAGKSNDEPKVEITEKGTVSVDGRPPATPPTQLIPIRHGGIEDESMIERVEGEEAARMLADESICSKCQVGPRAGSSVWCDDCLSGAFGGMH